MPLSSLGIRHSVSENAIVSGHRPAQYLLGPLILTTALLIGCGGGVAAAQLLAYSCCAPAKAGTYKNPPESSTLWHCPRCGAAMIVVQRFTAVELSACIYFDSS